MKIAVTGKGGVGKTTLSALLAQYFAREGNRVIAIDADPDSNLASALGFKDTGKIVPISEMNSLIEERTGAKPGQSGSFFKLNPKVDDLPEKLWLERGNLKLMVMGTVKKGGGGCVCPESTMLKALISHLVFYRDDIIIMDMEAGIEHLGRGTAGSMDMFIVVIEPGIRSVETAYHIKKLALELGISKISVVGSKIRKKADEDFIRSQITDIKILGFLPYDENLIETDMKGEAVTLSHPERIEEIVRNIREFAKGASVR